MTMMKDADGKEIEVFTPEEVKAREAIAIEQYQKDHPDQTVALETAKTAVAENAANGQPFASGWTPPNATINVATVATPGPTDRTTNANSGVSIGATGVITITYTNKISTGFPTIKLLPVANAGLPVAGTPPTAGSINWECHSLSAPSSDVLSAGTGLGTILEKYVPSNCRA